MQIFEFPTQVDHQKLNFVHRKKKGFMQNMRVCMEKTQNRFSTVAEPIFGIKTPNKF